jgi:hypothetical protein
LLLGGAPRRRRSAGRAAARIARDAVRTTSSGVAARVVADAARAVGGARRSARCRCGARWCTCARDDLLARHRLELLDLRLLGHARGACIDARSELRRTDARTSHQLGAAALTQAARRVVRGCRGRRRRGRCAGLRRDAEATGRVLGLLRRAPDERKQHEEPKHCPIIRTKVAVRRGCVGRSAGVRGGRPADRGHWRGAGLDRIGGGACRARVADRHR